MAFKARGRTTHRVGKSKVTKLTPKAGVVYPLIKLPKAHTDEIGKTAEIFETKHLNKRRFLVPFLIHQKQTKLYNLSLKLYNPTAQMTSNLALVHWKKKLTN